MQYLLDSDAVSALTSPQNKEDSAIHEYFSSLGQNTVISLCILTIYEFEYSIASCQDEGDKIAYWKISRQFESNFSILGLSFKDAKIYGELKAKFRQKTGINQNSLKRHNLDIALASVAIANNCIIVSKDATYQNHLQKIDSRLLCESWEKL